MADLPQEAASSLTTSNRSGRPFWGLGEIGEPRRDLLVLLLLGLLIFTAGLGLRGPWPADEPRYALVAQEMAESGHWLVPHRAGEIYPDKPPLFFWAVATSYLLTGSLRLAFLLPSLAAGILILCLVWDLARRLWGRSVALWTALALLTVLQFPLQVRSGQIDALLCAWTTLGLYGICRHLLLGPAWRWYNLGFFALGLGVITKGVGFLPILLLIPYAVGRWRRWPRLPAIPAGWRWAVGPLLMLAAIGLWIGPMLLLPDNSSGDLAEYRANILWQQTAERYANSWGHLQPPWFLIVERMPTLWWPLSWLLPWLLPGWWRQLRNRDARCLVLVGWIVLVVLFFSASPGKRGVYLLPAVPALALAVGPLAADLWARKGVQRLGFAMLAGLTALLLAASVAGFADAPWASKIASESGTAILPCLAALALYALVCTLWARPRRGFAGLAAFVAGAWLIYGWWGYVIFDPVRSTATLMNRVGTAIGPAAELALVAWKEQLILHADRPIVHFGYATPTASQEAQAAAWLLRGQQRRVMLPASAFGRCLDLDRALFLEIKHRESWYLVDAGAVRNECSGDDEAGGRLYRYPTAPSSDA